MGHERPIRVLRIIARMNVGGPALQVTAMKRLIDPALIEQRILCGRVSDGEADYVTLRAPDVERTFVSGLGRDVRLLGEVRAFWAIVKEIRAFRPDIVHTHTAKAGVLGRIAAIATRVPVRIHTYHGHVLHGYFSDRTTRIVVFVERVLARYTAVLVAVGDKVRDDLLAARIGSPSQYHVVPPGVRDPFPQDRSTARRALGVEPDETVVVFVGRLTKIKRAERFVEMSNRLHRPGLRWLLFGDGPERAGLDERNRALGGAVEFRGWLADVANAYATADLIVLTSDNEGMPVALIEAAMQGVPAVSTDVGAVRMVVLDGTTGSVVPVNDPAALDGAVRTFIEDTPFRRAAGTAARSHALAKFSEERLAADMTRIYVAAHGGSSRE